MKRKSIHPTEVKYPNQCSEYKKIVDTLYQLHLDKNLEYSPNNVKALGVLGLNLRIFEKTIRALNILGWDVWEGKPKPPIEKVKFDSVDRELDDIANLSIIAKILLKEKWAK